LTHDGTHDGVGATNCPRREPVDADGKMIVGSTLYVGDPFANRNPIGQALDGAAVLQDVGLWHLR
jgi:hypothetical protein